MYFIPSELKVYFLFFHIYCAEKFHFLNFVLFFFLITLICTLITHIKVISFINEFIYTLHLEFLFGAVIYVVNIRLFFSVKQRVRKYLMAIFYTRLPWIVYVCNFWYMEFTGLWESVWRFSCDWIIDSMVIVLKIIFKNIIFWGWLKTKILSENFEKRNYEFENLTVFLNSNFLQMIFF